jgi:hypothetical protein
MKLSIIFILLTMIALLLVSGCIQKSATCNQTVKTSSEAPAHVHWWCLGEQLTKEYCTADNVCHKHAIKEPQNLAEAAGVGPHTHTLKIKP